MKKVLIFIALITVIPLYAEKKIGYIDSQRILQEYRGAKEIQKRYEEKVNQWKNEVDALKEEIQKLQRSLQTQNMMLSEEAKMRKMREIQEKQRQYQEYVQRIWGQGGEAEQLNQELMQPLLQEIDTLISNIGKEEGYTMILDASAGSVVYADDTLDITDRVLEALNRKYMPEESVEGKIEYHVFTFNETDSDSKSMNLGSRIKNLIATILEGVGGYEKIESSDLNNAKNSLGILREEEVTESQAQEILDITDGDFVVLGETWVDGGDIYLKFNVIDQKQGVSVINKEVKVGVEDNLQDKISEEVTPALTDFYK